jgi:hypothetical protein
MGSALPADTEASDTPGSVYREQFPKSSSFGIAGLGSVDFRASHASRFTTTANRGYSGSLSLADKEQDRGRLDIPRSWRQRHQIAGDGLSLLPIHSRQVTSDFVLHCEGKFNSFVAARDLEIGQTAW